MLEATSSGESIKRTRGCHWSYGAITTVLQPWERYELINDIGGSSKTGELGFFFWLSFLFFLQQFNYHTKGGMPWITFYSAALSEKYI